MKSPASKVCSSVIQGRDDKGFFFYWSTEALYIIAQIQCSQPDTISGSPIIDGNRRALVPDANGATMLSQCSQPDTHTMLPRLQQNTGTSEFARGGIDYIAFSELLEFGTLFH